MSTLSNIVVRTPDSLRRIASAIWKAVELIRWPLPKHFGYRAAFVLILVLMPFLPLEWMAERVSRSLAMLAIALAVWGLSDMIIVSLQIAWHGEESIRAKQLGLHLETPSLEELGGSRWSVLSHLFFALAVVACTIVIAISSITWSLINHLGFRGPFQSVTTERLDVLFYFIDEAARGLTFRLLADLGIAVPDKLQMIGSLGLILLMWVYKTSIALLTVQVGWLWLKFFLAELDPEVRRLSDEIRDLTEENRRLERKDIFSRQSRHEGRLTDGDVAALEDQLYYEYEARDAIRQSLNWTEKPGEWVSGAEDRL